VKHWLSNFIVIASLSMLSVVAFADESAVETQDKTDDTPPQAESLFTPQERAWLEKKQVITYVYDPDWAPFEWKNEFHNTTGIIPDILNLIKTNSGMALKPLNTETWEESV